MPPDSITGLKQALPAERPVCRVLLHLGQLKSFIWQPWRQFKNLLTGDRYFFAHGGRVGSQFNQNQVQLIRKIRMSDIVCKNSAVAQVRRKAFETVDKITNPLTNCSAVHGLDIDAVLGERGYFILLAN